jgi:hypothetical protein
MYPDHTLEIETPRIVSCRDCRYWSHLIAGTYGAKGEFQAYCLSQRSPNHHEFTAAASSCAQHEPGDRIDDPSLQVT